MDESKALSDYAILLKRANDEADILRAQLAEGRAKWISIVDRYPPVAPDGWSDLVQICADGEVGAGYWSEPDNAWMTGYDEIPNQNRITHWCPMADPPNAKQSTPAPNATALRETLETASLHLECACAMREQRGESVDDLQKIIDNLVAALLRSEPQKEPK